MPALKPGLVALAAFLCLAYAAPAFATPPSHAPAWGYRNNPGKSSVHSAPGPLAGAGLPFLIAAGATGVYKLVRRRRGESGQKQAGAEGQ